MFKLSGLIPAVFTPFDKTGAINFSQIQPYADKLIAEGAYGVFVCGSTGECTSMTVAERKSVLEAWVEAAAGEHAVGTVCDEFVGIGPDLREVDCAVLVERCEYGRDKSGEFDHGMGVHKFF